MTLLLPEVLQEEECVLFKVQRELGRKTGGETYSLFSSLDTPSPAVPSLVVPPLHLPTTRQSMQWDVVCFPSQHTYLI